ncbi:hypothetical protein HNQ80_002558 [Anaerosolibacter carboniphilus]|uniref:Uncharacterized protein n=1 Tax=Anaerosolibacter carboniphilus TaxID=1417629 RepID=A0A841KSA8_9FIRM|nr:hypothetical protein [Anaerosolibacter carboniphilus]
MNISLFITIIALFLIFSSSNMEDYQSICNLILVQLNVPFELTINLEYYIINIKFSRVPQLMAGLVQEKTYSYLCTRREKSPGKYLR